jgi:hypothetical protein
MRALGHVEQGAAQRAHVRRRTMRRPARERAARRAAVGRRLTGTTTASTARTAASARTAVEEHRAVLHQYVKHVQPVRVGERFRVLVGVVGVELGYQIREPVLAARQEAQPQLRLGERAHAPQVPNHPQALGQLHAALQARQQLLAHRRARLGGLRAQRADRFQVAVQ